MRSYKILSFSVVILLIAVAFAGAVTVPAAAQSGTIQNRYNAAHTGDYSSVTGAVPSNGQMLWNFTTNGSASTPIVANGVVYVGSNDSYALNATTGTELWNTTVSNPDAPVTGTVNVVAVANGMVYLMGTSQPMYGEPETYGTPFYALNATTGVIAWSYTQSEFLGLCGFSSFTVANGVVYLGGWTYSGTEQFYQGTLYAFNATTGAELWSYSTSGPGTSGYLLGGAAVYNGVVYFVSLGQNFPVSTPFNYLIALNATTGANVWNDTTGSAVPTSPTVANGGVYVGSSDNNVYAFNANNGTELWNYTTGDWVSYSPTVVNGVAYVQSGNYIVYTLNAATGAELWNTTGSLFSVVNGVAYVQSSNDTVYALNATTGAELWNYTTEGWVFSSSAAANGVVYAVSGDELYAIGQSVLTPTSSPAATTASGVTYLFERGSDNSVWYMTWNGSAWSNATSLGGNVTAAPAITSSGSSVYVFATGTDNAVWYKVWNGSAWSPWHSLSGTLATGTSPAATESGSTVYIVAQGANHGVWVRTLTTGWTSLGGVLATDTSPAATSVGSTVYAFGEGTNNGVWYRTLTSGTWHSLGGTLATGTSPAATTSGSTVYVIAEGTNNGLWIRTLTAGWHSVGAPSSGITLSTSPGATSPSSGTLDVYVLSNGLVDQSISTNSGATWGVWTSTGSW